MLKVKVCGLTEPANIEEIAGLSPDFMGFIFYPGSKRFIGPQPASLFVAKPEGILRTGVFVDEILSRITGSIVNYSLDVVQLHGNEGPGFCMRLKETGKIIVKAIEVSDSLNFRNLIPFIECCDYFLFDAGTGGKGGSGQKFNWARLNDYDLGKPFLLGGGVGPDDATSIKGISHPDLFAVDINSRFEISPGIKDVEKVKKFICEIKA
jgi:phosphoribosylanthranilate isomerase